MSTTLFDPIEYNIISLYLGSDVEDEPRTNPWRHVQDYLEEEETGAVRIRRSLYNDLIEFSLQNAVARIVLNSIQTRLPQWAATNKSGEIIFNRQYESHRVSDTAFIPLRICMINWASSGPGFSWPEDYHVTFLPLFDHYVVTASQDGPDAYGYADIAIGHFPCGTPLLEGCKNVITSWWQEHGGGDPDFRWEHFWTAGLLDEDAAQQWADSVWGSEEEAESDELLTSGEYTND